ncbi:MAG: hypothetical protein MPJ78_20455, partial [Hyphomicrobiaceae bacterium]|nr:hypothetical protein [Hyphomicrobiaceae bacterium]
TLGKHAEQHQIDADAQVEIDRCQEIMLLPALMEFATYPSLHSAFSEVPLVQINSSHLLPDSLVQAGPVGGKGPVDKTIPELHVEFDAKGYRIHVPEPVGSLYRTLTSLDMARLRGLLEAREIKHEMEAFEALKGIGEEVWLNDIDEDREDRTLAAKLGEAIRTNRTKYGSRITHMAMGSRMYQRYLRSARIRGSPVPGSSTDTPGVGPLPGLEYVTVIISRLIDSEAEGTIYAVDRHAGALYGQGAIVLDTFENKNGRTAMITEYYQYMITDKHVDRASVDPPGRRTALRINVP